MMTSVDKTINFTYVGMLAKPGVHLSKWNTVDLLAKAMSETDVNYRRVLSKIVNHVEEDIVCEFSCMKAVVKLIYKYIQ